MAGIEIQRAWFGIKTLIGKHPLQGIGPQLDRRQSVRCNESLKGQELLTQVRPHRWFVVASLIESERFAEERNRAESLSQAFASPRNRPLMSTERGDDQKNRRLGTDVGHRHSGY